MDRINSLLASFDQSARDAREIARSRPFRRTSYRQLGARLVGFIEQKHSRPTWIIMPGLRGVGKSILLAQLYNHPRLQKESRKFYLSLDSIANRQLNYQDISEAIESRLGCSLHDSPDRIFIFLDEVHFWGENWDLNLKILYDRYPNLFLACTGSSALALNMTPDSARRAEIIRISPLSLAEYVVLEAKIRQNLAGSSRTETALAKISRHFEDYLVSDTPRRLEQALFAASDGQALDRQLTELGPDIEACWSIFDNAGNRAESPHPATAIIEPYVNRYLTMPYAIEAGRGFAADVEHEDSACLWPGSGQRPISKQQMIENELGVKGKINQTLGLVLERDLDAIQRFDPQTKSMTFDFLHLLANSDTISLKKINKHLSEDRGPSLSINTIRDLLKALRRAEILNEIRPLSLGFGRTAKPSKYLFSTPALRAALSPLILAECAYWPDSRPLNQKYQLLRGRLLEDAVGMYLKRLFVDPPLSVGLEYDASEGGADLIITRISQKIELIPLEVGWNKQSHRQVAKTRKGLKYSPYGLVITAGGNRHELDNSAKIARIPLSTFLLI